MFTQRWVLTLGTGCSSCPGASGAAGLIECNGRNSEGQMHWTGPLDISTGAFSSAVPSEFKTGALFVQHFSFIALRATEITEKHHYDWK